MLITSLQIENDLVRRFSLLGNNAEMMMVYIIELGKSMPMFPEHMKCAENLVRGCHSKVWLTTTVERNRIFFLGDSNTAITRGLVSILIKVLNGKGIQEVSESNLSFLYNTGLEKFLGTKRSNGLVTIHQRMREDAASYGG
jgi:cysteine desulfuration protein SufE